MFQIFNAFAERPVTIRCPVCNDVFDRRRRPPKLLGSCWHMICHRCLLLASSYAGTSTDMMMAAICPICHSTTPYNAIMTDFATLEKTERLRLASIHIERNCGHCGTGLLSTSPAAWDTVCGTFFCQTCCFAHAAESPVLSHRLPTTFYPLPPTGVLILPLTMSPAASQPQQNRKRGDFCTVHPSSPITNFCSDCYLSVCVDCVRFQHKNHHLSNCSDVDSAFSKLNLADQSFVGKGGGDLRWLPSNIFDQTATSTIQVTQPTATSSSGNSSGGPDVESSSPNSATAGTGTSSTNTTPPSCCSTDGGGIVNAVTSTPVLSNNRASKHTAVAVVQPVVAVTASTDAAPSKSKDSTSPLDQNSPNFCIRRQRMLYHVKFGDYGTLEGQFTEPTGICCNAQNELIIADANSHRAQVFDIDGRFKFSMGQGSKATVNHHQALTHGSATLMMQQQNQNSGLLYPNRVAVCQRTGDIAICERPPSHQVKVYNQYGAYLHKFGSMHLRNPKGICVDALGRVIVLECKVMRVTIFRLVDGELLRQFSCGDFLEFPTGVAANADRDEIYICDNRAHCIWIVNYDGALIGHLGHESLTKYPVAVAVSSNGNIIVADNHRNFNLTVFTPSGQVVEGFESKVKHAQVFDMALLRDGRNVAITCKDYRVYIYHYQNGAV